MTAQVRIDECGEVRVELESDTQFEADLLAEFEKQQHAGGLYCAQGSVDAAGRRDLQIRPLRIGRPAARRSEAA